ncbi:MAG TPA: AbrB/MazE/SpoVT family DNA-binding domain-containing protein [Vicinamibacterales bacterium]|nr:AbrB/MazE/SpoVT family DNA-binding domain-containing protein [Vicinamibacterales bacterium]
MATRTRIVRIGNSQGIRVPRALLEQAHLREEVEIYARPGRLVVRPVAGTRAGWADAAEAAALRGDNALLDAETRTRFDQDEWEW